MSKRIHIVFPKSLDSQCAAAIVAKWARDESLRIEHYPYRTITDESDGTATRQNATLLARIQERIKPISEQKQLEELDAHVREDELIFLIGVKLPDTELTELNAWGDVHSFTLTQDRSLCERLWKYFYPVLPMPLCVQLIGRFEIAKRDDNTMISLMENELLPFHIGMRAMNTDPFWGRENWEKLFNTLANPMARKVINDGKTIIRFFEAIGQDVPQLD